MESKKSNTSESFSEFYLNKLFYIIQLEALDIVDSESSNSSLLDTQDTQEDELSPTDIKMFLAIIKKSYEIPLTVMEYLKKNPVLIKKIGLSEKKHLSLIKFIIGNSSMYNPTGVVYDLPTKLEMLKTIDISKYNRLVDILSDSKCEESEKNSVLDQIKNTILRRKYPTVELLREGVVSKIREKILDPKFKTNLLYSISIWFSDHESQEILRDFYKL
jgi:hypothetical protein